MIDKTVDRDLGPNGPKVGLRVGRSMGGGSSGVATVILYH